MPSAFEQAAEKKGAVPQFRRTKNMTESHEQRKELCDIPSDDLQKGL